mmetsp:Transcript_31304/g.77028  ORF Transcript_31304/g.77028 Transcript_31304/m.77028 type:complete len:95 (-) Transcript_31304:779-1063(-)
MQSVRILWRIIRLRQQAPRARANGRPVKGSDAAARLPAERSHSHGCRTLARAARRARHPEHHRSILEGELPCGVAGFTRARARFSSSSSSCHRP